jgi:regulator of protease activity HflC (stomatin/prohibitin superfamily)
VMTWERGAYYICGRFWRVMGPGLKFVPPFFTELQIEGVVPSVFITPLQTITTRDGGTLTFSAAVTLELEDIGRAHNRVMNWDETALELTSGILAEKLAEVDAPRLDPEKRGRLVSSCVTELQKELGPYGIKVSSLRFNNFVRNMRVYRLLQS